MVIAVIAILSALLLPALGKARETAKSISCVNNLKQMGTGMLSYSDDHNGYLPGVYANGTTWYVQWGGTAGALLPYLGPKWGPGSVQWCLANKNGFNSQLNYLGNNTVLGGMVSVPQRLLGSLAQPARNALALDASITLGSVYNGYWTVFNNPPTHVMPAPHGDGKISNVVYADGHAQSVVKLVQSVDLLVY